MSVGVLPYSCTDEAVATAYLLRRGLSVTQDKGIEHRLSPPNSPQTNGMVVPEGQTPKGLVAGMPQGNERRDQRFNGRISELLQQTHISLVELETRPMGYADANIHRIPQRALNHQTPN
ncbi:hypothetical protein [Halothiobacillus sp.]|uniref:hypothetical protein n=1 Tax=Halothiobacillus sp. TaxID=1891311 RepID=UPI00261FA1EE|nr:hypothetical protein [Halothiobacillus sp.]